MNSNSNARAAALNRRNSRVAAATSGHGTTANPPAANPAHRAYAAPSGAPAEGSPEQPIPIAIQGNIRSPTDNAGPSGTPKDHDRAKDPAVVRGPPAPPRQGSPLTRTGGGAGLIRRRTVEG